MPENVGDSQRNISFSDRNDVNRDNKVVIIFINGFMVPPTWIPYNVNSQPKDFLMYNVTPSCVGSLHDRACYIFYQIKGGRINYGKQHSEFHGHCQYGEEEFPGLYPEWDESHPVILIGHSLGGLTALTLQNYLADEEGKTLGSPYRTSANWIKGIITAGTPWSGALRTYTKGMNLYQIPIISYGSQGYFIGLGVTISEFLNCNWFRRNIKTFESLHWKTSLFSSPSADSIGSSLFSQLKRCFFPFLILFLACCGYGIHTNTDNASFDITVQTSKIWNEYLRIFPNTFYFALAGHLTFDEELEEERTDEIAKETRKKQSKKPEIESEERERTVIKKGIREELEEVMIPKGMNDRYLKVEEAKKEEEEEEEETTTCENSNTSSMVDDILLSSSRSSSLSSPSSSSSCSSSSELSPPSIPTLLLSSAYSPTFHYWLKFLMKHDYSSDLSSIPKRIADLVTSSWHDEGNDGLIDVYSQRIPSHLLSKKGKEKEEYEKRIITVPCSSFFSSSSEGGRRKRTEDYDGIEWKPGYWYRSVVRNTCHLSILFQCPSTWKLLYRLINIMEDNYQKRKKSPIPTGETREKAAKTVKTTTSCCPPDQLLPHLEFHYHYHLPHHIVFHSAVETEQCDNETSRPTVPSSVFSRILLHLKRCLTSHLTSFCSFIFFVFFFLLFFQKPLLASFSSFSLLCNYYFLLSQLVQLLLCVFFLLLSITDVDCTEKIILFFNSCRISFLLCFFSYCLFIDRRVSASQFLPYFLVNGWLESSVLFCFSDSHVSSPYHHNHCPRDNNRYTGMIFGKTAFLMLLYHSSSLSPSSSSSSSSASSFIVLLVSYYLLISLAPLSWQWIYHQKEFFQISSSQTTLSSSQIVIAFFVIACHLVHFLVLIVFLTQFYLFLSSLSSSSSSPVESLEFFPLSSSLLSSLSSYRLLLILFAFSISSVLLSNYQLLSQNIQFTLLKLQFWRFYLSKQLLK
jgi:hypothetical protein